MSNDLGLDRSGNGNNWTVSNLTASDQVKDSPTNNFCTLNPLYKGSSATLSEGNLKIMTSAYFATGTHSRLTGKWYFEQLIQSSNGGFIGVTDVTADQYAGNHLHDGGNNTDGWGYYKNGNKLRNGSYQSYGSSFTTGDIMGCAFDLDNSKIYFSKNGTWQNSGNPATGANPAYTDVNKLVSPRVGHYNSNSPDYANFGQDSSFAGNKTAQGNQDSNGIGDFYYTPPTGFLALCTSNLPDVDIVPSEHFNTVLWTGNGSTQSITGVGFEPSLVWGRGRSHGYGLGFFDQVRGATKTLNGYLNDAEYTQSGITSFDSDGFSLGSTWGNQSSRTQVGWNWKANGSGSSNTNGSITSTVSANQDAGFSIAAFTGTGSNATVGHGLSSAPEMVIVKNRGASNDWHVYVEPLGATDVLIMNLDYAKSATANAFNSTAPTSTVFSVGSNGGTNQSSKTMVAYCFHSVDGYSKVGSYVGNANADGTFVYTGFRPAFVMIKSASNSAPWAMWDSKRDIDNSVVENIRANDNAAEYTSGSNIGDFTANGFKLRGTGGDVNSSSGYTYIYLAFAETPFKYSNAR